MADDIQPIGGTSYARVGIDTASPSSVPEAPAQVQPIPLSDGIHYSYIGAGATPAEIEAERQHGESMLADTYMAKAKELGAPYSPTKPDGTPGGMIYSATSSYPNNTYGQGAAALDHAAGADVSAPAARIASQAGAALAVPLGDPTFAGLNALKQQFATARNPLGALVGQNPPGVGLSPAQRSIGWLVGPGETEGGVIPSIRGWANAPQTPPDTEPVPLLSEQIRNDLGATGTEMPADASFKQRVAEAVASGALTRLAASGIEGSAAYLRGATPAAAQTAAATAAQGAPAAAAAVQGAVNPVWNAIRSVATNPITRDALWSSLGTEASDVAGRWTNSPVASYLAGLVFGGGVPGRTILSSLAGPYAAKANAPDIQAAWARQRGPNDPELPSFQTLATPAWQKFATFLAGTPIAGSPVASAQEGTLRKVQNIVRQAANAIAGGGLPPGVASPEHVGAMMTAGARDAVSRVRDAMNALYAPINQVTPGESFDVTPVAQGLTNRLAQNPLTPASTQALSALLGNLTEAAPGYSSTVQGPSLPGQIRVPMSVGQDWLSRVSKMLGPSGPLTAQDTPVLDMKNDVVNAFANRLDQLQPGYSATVQGPPSQPSLGNQFRTAREGYADLRKNALEPLYGLSGQPQGSGFTPVPEKSAYSFLYRNRMSPTALDPITRWFSPEHWGNVAGSYLSGLGTRAEGTDFRADKVAEDLGKIGTQVQTQLTGGTPATAGVPGGVGTPYQDLRDAATIGHATVSPISRHGLGLTAGASSAAAAALYALAHSPLLSGLGAAAIPAATYGTSRFLESTPLKQAMTGANLSPVITSQIYSAMPRMGAIQAGEEERRRQNFYPGGIGPWGL